MKRYPTYLTVSETEFLVMLVEDYERTRGFHEREGLRRLRDHLTRSVEKVLVSEVLGGER